MALRGVYYLTGSKNDPVCRYYTRAPVGVDAEVVPVDPGQPRREVTGIPVHGARRPQLASEALLDVSDGLEVTQEDLTQQ